MSDATAADTATKGVAYWLPLITAFVGFATGGFLEWMRDRRSYKREKEARNEARREAQRDRRDTFQRQTLLDLQDAVMKLIRTTGEMNHVDRMASRFSGGWRRQQVPDDLNERAFAAGVQTTVLGVRVYDDQIRELLARLKAQSGNVQIAASETQSIAALNEMGGIFETLNGRIGEVLRKMDTSEMTP